MFNQTKGVPMGSGKQAPALLFAAVLVLSASFFLPGIVMSDTMTRWAGVYTVVGQLDIWWGLELWLAPTMTWFMLPFAATGLGPPYFLLAQIAYLMFGGFAWIHFSSGQRPWWVAMVFMIPVVFVFASFIVPDVWTLAAILVVVGCFHSFERHRRVIPAVVFLFSCVVLFGFRQNSLVLVPFVWFFIVRLKGPTKGVKAAFIAITIGALAIIKFVPPIVGFEGPDSSASAPAWELVGAIRLAKESGMPMDPTLTLDGIADTDIAARRHSFVTIDTLIWGDDAAVSTTAIMQHSAEIKSRWLQMVINHPILYAKTKIRIYECMIGLCPGYLPVRIACVTPWPLLNGHVQTCASTTFGPRALETLNRAQEVFGILLLPVLWIPISAVVMFLSWGRYGRYDKILITLAAAYLGSFFVLNQAATFRYLFPTYVVFAAYQIRFLLSLPKSWGILKHARQGDVHN
ncbi:hypothetical protein [Achromobacter sp. NFACC18-2]|uniref:hypothetical protein n=1 Tax=Achromobacter sp. NFACC18-2 TaxID=1564112 RepID=UPI0008BEAF6E|nr:hypothetical protein [Achromobacter sp. NFACC18-2]SEJ41784.1 hypothetical protein SAMN03159494_02325 [Achromobacter sp. NFACC18-2]